MANGILNALETRMLWLECIAEAAAKPWNSLGEFWRVLKPDKLHGRKRRMLWPGWLVEAAAES